MKTLLTLAAALAAFTSVSAASAQDRGPGHWEWRYKARPGANKSQMPPYQRIWVVDPMAVSSTEKMRRTMTACAAKSCCAEGQAKFGKHNNNNNS